MIRRSNEMPFETVEHFKGGAGRLVMRTIQDETELKGYGRKFGNSILNPGCAIGTHTHHGDSEAYYIISGKGRYNDNGTWCEVGPGDLTYCEDGETHGLECFGDEPLTFIALILYTEPKKQ